MAESAIPITTGSGQASVASDLVSGNNYQQIKLVDGTLGSLTPLKINADGSITASIYGNITTSSTPNQSVSGTIQTQVQASVAVVIIGGSILTSSTANQSVSGTIGASIIGTAPVTQSGSWTASVVGGPITLYAPTASFVSGVTSVMTGTSSVQVLAPAAGGQRNYITNVLVTNAAAVGTTVQLFDGGNVIYAGFAAASGGGFALSFPAPLKQSSIAGNLSALSTVQASVFVSASGYTAS